MLRMAVLAGMSVSEALNASPGIIWDMYSLWKKENGYQSREED